MVAGILTAAGQGLQRDQVPGRRDRYEDVREYFQPVGSADDLVLDAGVREQQVDERSRRARQRPDQPRRREPVHVVLLDQRGERVPADLQPVDDPLGLPVVRDGDREVDVPGEPGLRTERHRQAPDDRPPGPDRLKVRGRLPQDFIDRPRPTAHLTGQPAWFSGGGPGARSGGAVMPEHRTVLVG
jgi:hypothetical protein